MLLRHRYAFYWIFLLVIYTHTHARARTHAHTRPQGAQKDSSKKNSFKFNVDPESVWQKATNQLRVSLPADGNEKGQRFLLHQYRLCGDNTDSLLDVVRLFMHELWTVVYLLCVTDRCIPNSNGRPVSVYLTPATVRLQVWDSSTLLVAW